jgi:branched-chain amino acid transport system permease protein
MLGELQIIMSICLTSLPIGSIYCLLALSFVLIYRATKIFNLCQGEIMMVGAYMAYSAVQCNVPFWLAVIISLVMTSVVALCLEKYVLRNFVGKPISISIMVTLGLGILMRGLIGILWGVEQKVLEVPMFEQIASLPLVHMTYGKASVIAFCVLAIVGLEIFFKHSRLGAAIRATASNLNGAMLMGVNIWRIFALSWVLAAVISAITGIFVARLSILEPGISQYAFIAIAALVLGGFDSIKGAIVGGFIIGIFESLAVFYIGGQSKHLVGFVVMFLVLMIRPYGIFGIKKVARV